MKGVVRLCRGDLRVSVFVPNDLEGYYRGTRFDWAGVFEGIEYRGCNYAEPWFETYSPFMHDAVCGPAEEFSPIGYEDAAPGGLFLKIGVGVLERIDEGEYDRFRLHRIMDPGTRGMEAGDDYVVFTHEISSRHYGYVYRKEIRLLSDSSFRIRHSLRNTGTKPLKGDVYNHNFFTLGLLEVGEARRIAFPYHPEGTWRADYDSVALTDNGIHFSRRLARGESVYMGNIHETGRGLSGSPDSFIISDGRTGRGVRMTCAVPMTRAVFWSNHRIACIEPYIGFDIVPDGTFAFDIDYNLI